jgi:IS5 family transposase
MLQKWFRINSDPELENQINDRLSFKKFLGLPLSNPSPDHSTFSRFRSRLSKNAMDQLNSEILRQFEAQGLTINEGVAVDANHGFILNTIMTPASIHDTNYLPYCTVYSRHTGQSIEKVYADKGYAGQPNRDFLALNQIADGIMRKDSATAKITDYEKERNTKISKVRYIVEQYFGISHLHDGAKRARFTTIAKNNFDAWCRQAAYNIRKGLKVLKVATV